MTKCIGIVVVILLFICSAAESFGETFILQDKSCQRTLQIVRHYDISVKPGKPSAAAIPALMSFWGATNWQVIKSSEFKYGEQPDKIDITTDDLGMLRRNYVLTWNSPKSDKISVDQTLEVELSCFNALYTTAKYPYTADELKRFPHALQADEKGGINPDNKDLVPICDGIVKKSHDAEEIVEGVCDWINTNIKFVKVQRTSDECLAQKQGSCSPMSRLACAMLRHIGIPAEVVEAKFIGGDGGHAYIEVYFPDAGWVFYDLSNWNRGFKSLDGLPTVGFAYRSGPVKGKMSWTEGQFCVEKDVGVFRDVPIIAPKLLSKSPADTNILKVVVFHQPPPATVKPRFQPLNALLMDVSIPPGPRPCSDDKPASLKPAATTAPAHK